MLVFDHDQGGSLDFVEFLTMVRLNPQIGVIRLNPNPNPRIGVIRLNPNPNPRIGLIRLNPNPNPRIGLIRLSSNSNPNPWLGLVRLNFQASAAVSAPQLLLFVSGSSWVPLVSSLL